MSSFAACTKVESPRRHQQVRVLLEEVFVELADRKERVSERFLRKVCEWMAVEKECSLRRPLLVEKHSNDRLAREFAQEVKEERRICLLELPLLQLANNFNSDPDDTTLDVLQKYALWQALE